MADRKDKLVKIVPVLLKYGYGKQERGESLEKLVFFPVLKEMADVVIPFWLEDNGYPEDRNGLQDKIIEFVNQEKPDIVFFILMRDEISIETIEVLSNNYLTVNWFCDDQWRFETFTKYVAPQLSYSITVDKYSLPLYKKIGCDNVILSQWATFDYITDIDFSNVQYKYDVSFVGGKNPIREWYIYELKKAGFKVSCFGYGWENGTVSYDEMKSIFLNSKINLNLSNSRTYDIRYRKFLRHLVYKLLLRPKLKTYIELLKIPWRYILNSKSPKIYEQIKMRNFEIPGCGGFQLGHYAPTIEDYFIFGKEIAVFSNIDEMKKQVGYYLENDLERENIRTAGYHKAENHTYKKRFEKIFRTIGV
jgi:spore maturation protein CgeB